MLSTVPDGVSSLVGASSPRRPARRAATAADTAAREDATNESTRGGGSMQVSSSAGTSTAPASPRAGRSPSSPSSSSSSSAPKREQFADLKWMWSRHLTPPNSLTRDQMESIVIGSRRVQGAIDRATSEALSGVASATGGAWTRDDATKAAKTIFDGMYADINETNIRASMYVMRKVWRTMYEGIRVNEAGIARLHTYTKKKIPIVLLPMHKSHIDYLLLSYVCAAYHLYPPHIIAGDNLNMPGIGSLFKHGGGVFIRRAFGSDDLYKAVFYEYVAALLQNGHMLECFIEGTRGRTGKLKTPKVGFLSVLTDLLATGRLGEKDVMLVPIAISYDKVIEGTSFVNEMLGAKKQQETFTQTINSVNHVIRLNFGSIDVSICEGISLRQALGMTTTVPRPLSLPTSSPHSVHAALHQLDFLQLTSQEQKRVVRSLAHRICYEMNLRLVISPTSIIATVLLTNFNRGIARKDIIARAENIRRMVVERGGSVAHIFSVEPMAAVVDRAIKVLGKLVQEQHGIVFGFRNITSLELSFYRNQLLHLFISESLICVAMAAEHKDVKQIRTTSSSSSIQVAKSNLIESVRFISQLLKFEYVYKPAPELENNVELTIDDLIRRGVLRACQILPAADAGPTAVAAPGVSLNPSGIDSFLYLSMLTWPFIETYWVAIASLFILLPDIVMEAKKLSEVASRRAEALYYSGHIESYECLNTESIMNAYEWCIGQGILRVHQVGGTRMMQLMPEYQHSPEDHLPDVTSTLPTAIRRPATTASPSFSPPSSSPRKSLRELVLRVGRFRKIRLVATDSSKSLLESFVDELCATADQPPSPTPASAATNAAVAAQKLLSRM